MVTTLLPETNYSWYLCLALAKKIGPDFSVYTDKNEKNRALKNCGRVKLIWDKNFKFIFQIILIARKAKPAVIHLQHEINMYGGLVTTILFPWLLFFLKIRKIKIVTTLHAVVPLEIIDKKFIRSFRGETKISPWMLKLFFIYLNRFINFFSDIIIVHTNLLENVLSVDYGISEEKIKVLPHGVPGVALTEKMKGDYFLYFGYIVKRKGLENVICGYAEFIKENEEYANFKLVLAGGTINGQEFAKEDILELIEKLGISGSVEFTGFVNDDRIKELFERAYAVVIPAVISISASGPLAQAFAYGKCVIASRIGNFCEEIDNGEDGILVDNDDWKAAFSKVLLDQDLVKKIESNIKKKATIRNWDNVAKRHFEIYNELLS